MDIAEKIFTAKEKWNCSFDTIAFLLEMDIDIVREQYLSERKKRLLKIGINESDSIECLNLSNRAKNALLRIDVKTVGDLISLNEPLNKIGGLGNKTIEEIQNAVKAAGFSL